MYYFIYSKKIFYESGFKFKDKIYRIKRTLSEEQRGIYLKEYNTEYNNILVKPNKPFIPLCDIRGIRISNHMTKGIHLY